MATATRPPGRPRGRPRGSGRQPTPATPAAPAFTGDPIADARKLIAVAKRKATMTEREEGVNRSTRSMRAMRIRADAFEQIAELFTR